MYKYKYGCNCESREGGRERNGFEEAAAVEREYAAG